MVRCCHRVPVLAKGIGRATALAFADEGCNVAICAREAGGLAAVSEEITARWQHSITASVSPISAKK